MYYQKGYKYKLKFIKFKIMKKNKIVEGNISLFLIVSLVAVSSFMFFEPQITKAVTNEITITQGVSAEISIDNPTDVSMSPDIPGMTGGSATGTCTWTIKTNNNGGFKLELEASTAPALQCAAQSDSFADYEEAVANTPDYTWTVTESNAEFGYTVFPETPADADQSFKDNGSLCNVATNNPDGTKCWIGFAGVATKEQVVSRSTETDVSGEAEVVNFKAELNGPATDADGFLTEGSYTATLTATATINP